MADFPAYAGPVESLTVEEAAARNRCSSETFLAVYDGPRMYLGKRQASMLRIPAFALHEWMAQRAFTPGASAGGSWEGVGDGKGSGKGVPSRKQGAQK